MSRNRMLVLLYHRHKLLDLTMLLVLFGWETWSLPLSKDQNIDWVSLSEGFPRLCRKWRLVFRVVSWNCSNATVYIAVTTFSAISFWVYQLRMWKLLKCFDVHSSHHLQDRFVSKFSGVYVEVLTFRSVLQFSSSGWSDDGEAKPQNSNLHGKLGMFGPKCKGELKFQEKFHNLVNSYVLAIKSGRINWESDVKCIQYFFQ
jgi:hypothetical protein